jgi:hypothetical protein
LAVWDVSSNARCLAASAGFRLISMNYTTAAKAGENLRLRISGA